MKKIFSLTMLLAVGTVVLTGCKSEEDDLFSSSAAERLAESQKTYTKRLGGTTWVMEYYPLGTTELNPETRDPYPAGLGYVILNRFKTDGSVEQAMQNSVSNGQYLFDTSMWEIITDQGPVLSFNTFNKCIHAFADPGVSNSSLNLHQGRGYEGDYEFGVLSLDENAEYVMLKGKKRGTYIRMAKLPYDTDFQTYMTDITTLKDKIFPAGVFNNVVMTLGDTTFVFTKGSKGIAELYPVGGDPVSQNSWHPFNITKRNDKFYMRFREKIGRGNCDAQEFVYDATKDLFTCVENSAYTISGEPASGFFVRMIDSVKKYWTCNLESSMSDSFKSVLETANKDFTKTLKYPLKDIALRIVNDKFVLRCQYVAKGNKTQEVSYVLSKSADGSNVTLSFVEDVNVQAGNARKLMPGLQSLIDTICQTWVVSPNETIFDLNKVKLTATNDTNLWFVVSLN